MITVLTTGADGPLQPFATTWMLTVPVKLLAQLITPVTGLIVPAAALLVDHVKLVLLAAVDAKVVLGVLPPV
jgi:hypothetical protein